MQNLFDVVTGRRSIRRFTSQEVDDAILQQILDTARWTPSWANTQCWEIIVVRDESIKTSISELLSPKNPASIAIGKGPVTLAICGAKEKSGFYKNQASTVLGEWLMYDLGLISQTICLAAHALGLGSVIVGAYDHEKVRTLLHIPEEYELVSLIPLGYPDHDPKPPKRKTLEEFVHFDRF